MSVNVRRLVSRFIYDDMMMMMMMMMMMSVYAYKRFARIWPCTRMCVSVLCECMCDCE